MLGTLLQLKESENDGNHDGEHPLTPDSDLPAAAEPVEILQGSDGR